MRKPRALLLQQGVQRRVAVAVVERAEQAIHERQPLLRPFGNRGGPAASLVWTQPAPQTAIRRTVDPAHARQPVTKADQRADGIPPQRCRRGSHFALDVYATPLREHVLEDSDEVLAQPE